MEEEGQELIINDANSSILGKKKILSKSNLLIILVASLILVGILVLIILITLYPKKNKKYIESIGRIECIYDIDIVNKTINILNEQFSLPSIFDIQIEGQTILSSKKVIFSKYGLNKVTFVFYENINMAQIFKNISN